MSSAPLSSWGTASKTWGDPGEQVGGYWEERGPEARSDLHCPSCVLQTGRSWEWSWEELGGQALGILEDTMTVGALGPCGHPQGSPGLLRGGWTPGAWGVHPKSHAHHPPGLGLVPVHPT